MDKLDCRHGRAERALVSTYSTSTTYYYYVLSLRLNYFDGDGVLTNVISERSQRPRGDGRVSDVVRIVAGIKGPRTRDSGVVPALTAPYTGTARQNDIT